jgi:Outer membrane protein beta-barrel domain
MVPGPRGDSGRRAILGYRSALILALRALPPLLLVGMNASGVAHADVKDSRPGQWSGGAGVGFLANMSDGPEFGLTGHADYFLTQRLSVGPLVQYAGAGNDIVVGVSTQARYWWNIRASGKAKLVVQGGIGFAWADIEDTDSGAAGTYTSFVIPVGVGLDYAVTGRVAVTADLLLNFTSLGEHVRAGGREVDLHTIVMPGLFLGVRF